MRVKSAPPEYIAAWTIVVDVLAENGIENAKRGKIAAEIVQGSFGCASCAALDGRESLGNGEAAFPAGEPLANLAFEPIVA
jgi:hypothetical protein